MKKILFVGSEALPFAATGGLGDVLGALPIAINSLGKYDVRAVMPLYSSINEKYRDSMKFECEFIVTLAWRCQYCGVYSCELNGVLYYFIDNEYYFNRPSMYGSYDDGERYAYFCRAVMEMFKYLDYIPDIIHANDWQSALTVIYLKNAYSKYRKTKAVFTIHNIEYRGIYDFSILHDVFMLTDNDRQTIEYNGKINLLKGAVSCCDALTTVSENYAKEIQSEYYGAGLHEIIRKESAKLTGISNGIDAAYYNPLSDKEIKCNYSRQNLGGKRKCKSELQKILDMEVSENTPIIAMVSRLAEHKGFDLVCHVLEEMLNSDLQFVLLGTGESALEDYFRQIAKRYPRKTGIVLAFDKPLSKQIYAGADMFLMPSKSEPCGLSQMIAARYGTVPIVRRTGGLYSTITPFDPMKKTGNGFTFETYNAHDMLDAVHRAIQTYHEKELWNAVKINAMNSDFSWDRSAARYAKLYDNL